MYRLVKNPYNAPQRVSAVPACCCLFLLALFSGVFVFCVVPFLVSETKGLLRTPTDADAAFAQFVEDHAKTYASPEEAAMRQAIFAENYRKIVEYNDDPNHKTTLGVNQFADLTDDEFADKYLSKPKAPHEKLADATMNEPNADISKNWVTEGKVSAVKDQGNCGSCWTFSSTSTIETLHAIRNNTTAVEFSEQNLVDCCKAPLSNGCHGGEPTDAYKYVNTEGIALWADYPYLARDEVCRKDVAKPFHIDGYENVSFGNNTDMERVIMQRTMAVGISAGPFVFRFYKSGIIDTGCLPEPITHGVTVVGAGTDNGTPYWLVRNSWGPNWGDHGYVRMLRTKDGEAGTCGVASCAQYPKYREA